MIKYFIFLLNFLFSGASNVIFFLILSSFRLLSTLDVCWFNCPVCLHLAFNFHKRFNGRYKSIMSIVGSFRSFPLTLLRRPGWRRWIKTYIQLFIFQQVCRDWSLSYGSSLKRIAWKTWLLRMVSLCFTNYSRAIFFHLEKPSSEEC